MSRLMSVRETEAQVRDRTKTVTRRLGWKFLKPGDTLTLCPKVRGRKPGEELDRIVDVEVVSVRREKLWDITDEEIRLEGLTAEDSPGGQFEEWWWPDESGVCWPTRLAWIHWFCEAMDCRPDTEITRIEWRYLG